MKQKYTLSIADTEINVITDEPQESVEHIVGILDRKLRDIALKSKRCSKNEAALLCALDFCADKVKTKEQLDELEARLEELEEDHSALGEKLEIAQRNNNRLEKEAARLDKENVKLRALLDAAKAGKPLTDEDIAEATATETVEVVEEVAPVEEPAPVQKKKNKSRVGSMFDLLTFSDI